MTDDDESPGSGSASPVRVKTILTRTIDPPVRPRRSWRPPVIALVVIGVVAAGWWGAPRVPEMLDDGMRGPFGAFPQQVAAQPPLRSAENVAGTGMTYGHTVVYGGLVISGGHVFTRGHGGVRAVSIADGRTYWRYDKDSAPIGLDRATGDVVVQGKDLLKINVRSGRIRWSRPVPEVGADSVVTDANEKTLVVLGRHGITGVDREDGETRWTKRWPEGCSDTDELISASAKGIVAVACNDSDVLDEMVMGFDARTGAQRWGMRMSQLFPEVSAMPADETRYLSFTGVWQDRDRFAVAARESLGILDPTTGNVVRRARKDSPVAFSDGIQISECREGLCGSASDTGKRLWSSPFPGPGRPGLATYDAESVAVADGRAYAVTHTEASRGRINQMTVFDSRTGKVLGHMPVPMRYIQRLQSPIADGVVIIQGNAAESSSSYFLFVERPDLRGARKFTPYG
ncbi:hypothetical protein GCM10010191_54210 [Actinomadura vinacea]|uniref:Pyrrolo-quinoline quinone repeat domain-containing protein n=1 Tax=Actinomadura vinacea TaxID=115336 RepID=A0ABP5WQF2_9ACTN